MISVLTRILRGTIFDKIGTKKIQSGTKKTDRHKKQVSASHVTL